MVVRDSDGLNDWQKQRAALDKHLAAQGGGRTGQTVRGEELNEETWGTLPEHRAAEGPLLALGGTDDDEAPVLP